MPATAPIGASGAADPKDSGPRDVAVLQPQTLASILRNALRIYFGNLRTVSLIYLLPLLPLSALRILYEEFGGGDRPVIVALILVEGLAGLLIGAALVVAISDICIGQKPGLARSYRRGFANWGRLLGTYLLLLLLIILGSLLLVIPGILAIVWFMFALAVVVLEGRGGMAALRRSRELGRGSYLRNCGIIFVCTCFTCLLVVAYGIVVAAVTVAAVMLWEEMVLATLGGILAAAGAIALFGPLTSILLTLLYYDMRARKEGYGATQLAEDLHI